MTEREKVIKGIECMTNEDPYMSTIVCAEEKCPYAGIPDCSLAIWHDALELLKGQEPRVLTLEEARTYEVVWPEDKGEGELHPLIVQNNMNDSKHYKYGVHWRVWSAKPTDEQRRAVKWNG